MNRPVTKAAALDLVAQIFLRAHERAANRAGNDESVPQSPPRKPWSPTVAPVTMARRQKIADRDGWVCGICVEEIDPTLAYPDPFSASIDHVIPRAWGGGEEDTNLQLAHRWCNMKKGKGPDPFPIPPLVPHTAGESTGPAGSARDEHPT